MSFGNAGFFRVLPPDRRAAANALAPHVTLRLYFAPLYERTAFAMARLIVTFKDRTLQELPIETQEIGIGREPHNALHIDSLAIAPRHALVKMADGGPTLYPLDAQHPVFVNDQRITEHRLANGDRITIGKHEIIYRDDEPQFGGTAPTLKPLGNVREASLQVLKGKNIGLMIPLRGGMTRLGKDESGSAVIAKRKDGFFLSALSAAQSVHVNDAAVGEHTVRLNTGDTIRIGEHLFQFFCE